MPHLTVPRTTPDHEDLREVPRYTTREVARAVDVPPSTVGAWVRGYPYSAKRGGGRFEPVIKRPSDDDPRLSFNNLLEISVLRALREAHEIELRYIRKALAIAENEFGISRLLIDARLLAGPGEMFLRTYGQLLALSPSKQLAMETIVEQFLSRVDFQSGQYFPIERSPTGRGQRLILVTPFVSFGRPVISRLGISTEIVVERLNAGEARAEIIQDYKLYEPEFDEALLYEAAA